MANRGVKRNGGHRRGSRPGAKSVDHAEELAGDSKGLARCVSGIRG